MKPVEPVLPAGQLRVHDRIGRGGSQPLDEQPGRRYGQQAVLIAVHHEERRRVRSVVGQR
jgi:hypothetical protein